MKLSAHWPITGAFGADPVGKILVVDNEDRQVPARGKNIDVFDILDLFDKLSTNVISCSPSFQAPPGLEAPADHIRERIDRRVVKVGAGRRRAVRTIRTVAAGQHRLIGCDREGRPRTERRRSRAR